MSLNIGTLKIKKQNKKKPSYNHFINYFFIFFLLTLSKYFLLMSRVSSNFNNGWTPLKNHWFVTLKDWWLLQRYFKFSWILFCSSSPTFLLRRKLLRESICFRMLESPSSMEDNALLVAPSIMLYRKTPPIMENKLKRTSKSVLGFMSLPTPVVTVTFLSEKN